jgi:hypothetical protein
VLSLVDHGVSRTRQAAGLGRPRLRFVMPPYLPEALAVEAASRLRSTAAAAGVDVAWMETARQRAGAWSEPARHIRAAAPMTWFRPASSTARDRHGEPGVEWRPAAPAPASAIRHRRPHHVLTCLLGLMVEDPWPSGTSLALGRWRSPTRQRTSPAPSPSRPVGWGSRSHAGGHHGRLWRAAANGGPSRARLPDCELLAAVDARGSGTPESGDGGAVPARARCQQRGQPGDWDAGPLAAG